MLAWFLALILPLLQIQPTTRALSSRWHQMPPIQTGLAKLSFLAICPSDDKSDGHLFAVDSSGAVVELGFINREWTILDSTSIGEAVVTGCAAALRPDQGWSIIVGTKSGRIVELRRSTMGWGRHEVGTVPTPIRGIEASEPMRPGPSQLFVIDGEGEITNLYVGASGRWNGKPLPAVEGGHTHLCLDYPREGLCAITAGPRGVIHKFIQDSLGNWSGPMWASLSSGCRDLAASADPSMKDICFFYAGEDGHLRYMFDGRKDDVTSRLACAEDAIHLIGKGDQRRFNEFFGMVGNQFCLFEYDPGLLEWVKVPMGTIPSTVVSTIFGPARGATWHTMYVGTVDGRLYEFERDGLENE